MKLKTKLILSLEFLALFIQQSICVTYLRPKNDRGPGRKCFNCLTLQTIMTTTLIHFEGAMHAGVDCIERVERYFFKNSFSQQIQNIAVFHSKNMSSPAMEIEIEYLNGLHDRILHQEEDEDSFQLKVISEREGKRSIQDISFNDITLTDFYVVVADNLETVGEIFF